MWKELTIKNYPNKNDLVVINKNDDYICGIVRDIQFFNYGADEPVVLDIDINGYDTISVGRSINFGYKYKIIDKP